MGMGIISTFALQTKRRGSDKSNPALKKNCRMANISPNSENAIVTIHVTGNKQTVSAKELYERLELNKAHWAKWYKRNIQESKFFTEGEDWVSLTQGVNANGTPNMDFEITLDFAKRLSMMAKSAEAEKVRSYFIECEKKALTPTRPLTREERMSIALQDAHDVLAEMENRNKGLVAELAIIAPKAETLDRIYEEKEDEESLTTVGKMHNISAQRLVDILIEKSIFGKDRQPYMHFQTTHKWFRIIERNEPNKRTFTQILVTPSGQKAIHLLLNAPINETLFSSTYHGQQIRLRN